MYSDANRAATVTQRSLFITPASIRVPDRPPRLAARPMVIKAAAVAPPTVDT